MKIKKDLLEKLKAKGLVKSETVDRLCMSEGGIVLSSDTPEDLVRRFHGSYPDTGRTVSSPAEAIDSYVGAPIRTAIGEMQDGNFGSEMLKKSWKQVGSDPVNAPTGKAIAAKAGIDDQTKYRVPVVNMLGGPAGPILEAAFMHAGLPSGFDVTPAEAAGFGIEAVADGTPLLAGVAKHAAKLGIPLSAAVRKMKSAPTEFDANPILSKIDTPEKAVALKGAEREEYLNALESVYGPRGQRARDMGFDMDTRYFHGSPKPKFDEFDMSLGGSTSGHGTANQGIYFTTDLDTATNYTIRKEGGKPVKGSHIGEYRLRYDKPYEWSGRHLADDEGIYSSDMLGIIREAKAADADLISLRDVPGEQLFIDPTGRTDVTMAFHPNQARDIKAAFDPRFKDSKKLMAGGIGGVGMPDLRVRAPRTEAKEEKETSKMLDRDVAAKLVEKGLVKPETMQRLGFAAGGVVPSPVAIPDALNPNAVVSSPTAIGDAILTTPVPEMSPDERFQSEVEKELARFNDTPMMKERFRATAEDRVLGRMSSKKDSEDQAKRATEEKFFRGEQQKASEHSSLAQQFEQENARRKALGLAPKPMPESLKNAVAAGSDLEHEDVQLVSDIAPQPRQQAGTLDLMRGSLNASNSAFDLAARGVMDAERAGQQAAASQAAYMKRAQEESKAMQLDHQAKIDEVNSRVKDAHTKYEELSKDYLGSSVDPTRVKRNFWSNASTGQKFMAGLALFFGGFAKDGNSAVKVLENAIDRDINAQKADLDKKQFGISAQKSLLSDLHQQMGDLNTAQSAARAMFWDQAKLEIERLASLAKGPQARAQAATALAEIELKRQSHLSEMYQKVGNMAAVQQMGGSAGAQGGAPGGVPSWVPNDPKEAAKLLVPEYGFATTMERADKANELVASASTNLKGLKTLRSYIGRPKSDLAARSAAETAQQILIGANREDILGPGVITDAERAIMQEIIKNPMKVFALDTSTIAALDVLEQRIKQRRDDRLKQYGLQVKPELNLGARVR